MRVKANNDMTGLSQTSCPSSGNLTVTPAHWFLLCLELASLYSCTLSLCTTVWKEESCPYWATRDGCSSDFPGIVFSHCHSSAEKVELLQWIFIRMTAFQLHFSGIEVVLHWLLLHFFYYPAHAWKMTCLGYGSRTCSAGLLLAFSSILNIDRQGDFSKEMRVFAAYSGYRERSSDNNDKRSYFWRGHHAPCAADFPTLFHSPLLVWRSNWAPFCAVLILAPFFYGKCLLPCLVRWWQAVAVNGMISSRPSPELLQGAAYVALGHFSPDGAWFYISAR